MKNIRLVLLFVLLFSFCFTGCNSNNDSKDEKGKKKVESKDKKSDKSSKKEDEEDDYEEELELEEFNTEATIKEIVIVDTKGIKIIAKELTFSDYEAEIEIYMENNSKKDISVTAGSSGYSCNAVNHYMLEDGFMNVDVPKGKKARDKVAFDIENMQILGINKISDMYIAFSIEDDDYNDIYQGGKLIKTSLYEEDDTDTYLDIMKSGVLESEYGCEIIKIDEENIKLKNGVNIVSQTIFENEDGDKSVCVELENSSDEVRIVSLCDISLNDINVVSGMLDAEYMIPNSRVIIEMTLNNLIEDDVAELISLEDIEKVSYIVKLYNEDFNSYFASKTMDFAISNKKKSKDKTESNTGKKVYDKNNIVIFYNGVKEDDEYEQYTFVFMIENNRRGEVYVDVEGDSVDIDDFMVATSCLGKDLKPKTKGIFEFDISYDELEDNDIEKIKELEVELNICDDDYESVAKPKFKIDVDKK